MLKESLKTLIIAGIAMISLGVILFLGLDWYTRHDEKIIVPEVIGKTVAEGFTVLEEQGLIGVVTDTLFMADKPVHTILEQNPDKDSEVKSGRKVYLVVSGNKAPQIEVPDLKDLSEREAKAQLEARGFKVGKVISVPEFGGVVGLNYQGKSIAPKTKLAKGATIDIRIGRYTTDNDTTTTINLLEIE